MQQYLASPSELQPQLRVRVQLGDQAAGGIVAHPSNFTDEGARIAA